MGLPTYIRNGKEETIKQSLAQLGYPFAKKYLVSTTKKSFQNVAQKNIWWISSGQPNIIIECEEGENIIYPPATNTIYDTPAFKLKHFWFEDSKTICGVWSIENCGADVDTLRRLRVNISCLHSEFEGVKKILKFARDGDKLDIKRTPEISESLQKYLNSYLKFLSKEKRYGYEQDRIFWHAVHALGFVHEGRMTSVASMRRQVSQKIDRFIESSKKTARVINNYHYGDIMKTSIEINGSTVGDVSAVTAERISDSFNKVAKSSVNEDLKKRLEDLQCQVLALAKELGENDAETVAKDLSTFTDEVLSKAPRREWYSLSANGLVAAAKTVAGFSVPIANAVKSVLSLL